MNKRDVFDDPVAHGGAFLLDVQHACYVCRYRRRAMYRRDGIPVCMKCAVESPETSPLRYHEPDQPVCVVDEHVDVELPDEDDVELADADAEYDDDDDEDDDEDDDDEDP